MEICMEPELIRYMRERGKQNIVLDVASSNASDIEITEIFCRFATDSHADYLIEKKRFRPVAAPHGRVLLPSYRLVYDETLTFGLRKRLWFHTLTWRGVRI